MTSLLTQYRLFSLTLPISSVALAMPVTAYSQTAPAETTAPDTAGDIVVTAQRRSESASNVPISMVVASGDDLLAQGVKSYEELVKVSPGVTFTTTPYGTPVLFMRGVGFYESSLASTSPVATYIDETPLPYTRMALGTTLDIQRIEILKGPQGTLYGQNSTGGAVNYIVNKPTDSFEAGVNGSFGNYFNTELQGFVSGPLGDTLGIRVAGAVRQGDGWQRSITRPEDRLGATRIAMARVLLDWQASDRIRFELNVNGFRDKSDTQAPQPTAVLSTILPPISRNTPVVANGPAELADWDPDISYRRNNSYYQVALRGEFELANWAKIVSLTSYNDYKQDQNIGADGSPFTLADVSQTGFVHSFSQELRLQLSADRWDAVLGANYSSDKIKDESLLLVEDAGIGVLPDFPVIDAITRSGQQAKNYSVFGDATFAVTDRLKIAAGIRYSKQDRDFQGCLADRGNGNYAAYFGRLFGQVIAPGTCVTQIVGTNGPGLVRKSLNEDNVSWRANISYRPADDAMVYASVSRGYKAGSFGTVGAVFDTQYEPARQESLLAYEAGAKLRFWDRRADLNVAVYHYDYSDKQVRGKINVPELGRVLEVLYNVPDARVNGAEAEFTLRPVEGLQLRTSAAYVDSKILSSFVTLGPDGQVTDLKGQRFEFSPKWTWQAGADYDTPLAGNVNGFVGISARYQGPARAGYGTVERYAIKPYTITDARLGIRDSDDVWSAEFWVRNLFDKFYWTNANFLSSTAYRITGMPRTYGISASYKF